MRPGGKSNGESPFFEKPIFCRLRNGSGVCSARPLAEREWGAKV